MKNKSIYISGKIGDLPASVFVPKFARCQAHYENQGYAVVSPINLPHDHDKQWHSYMLEDLMALIPCDCIAVMPCHVDSPGAMIELAFAKRMGKEILYYDEK